MSSDFLFMRCAWVGCQILRAFKGKSRVIFQRLLRCSGLNFFLKINKICRFYSKIIIFI